MHRNLDVCRCLTMTYNARGVHFRKQLKNEQSICYLKKVVEVEEKMDVCYT